MGTFIAHIVARRKDDFYKHMHIDETIQDFGITSPITAKQIIRSRIMNEVLTTDLPKEFVYAEHEFTIGIPLRIL